MHNKELVRILNSPTLEKFWDDVRRIRTAQMRSLMDEEDVSYVKSVKALDMVLALPAQYENVVDNKNDE